VTIAKATTASLVWPKTRVLKAACEDNDALVDYRSSCGGDGIEFKGVFLRQLSYLLDALGGAPSAVKGRYAADIGAFEKFVNENAESIWTKAACLDESAPRGVGETVVLPPLFGLSWVGPCSLDEGSPSAVAQGSALDALVSAAKLATKKDVKTEV